MDGLLGVQPVEALHDLLPNHSDNLPVHLPLEIIEDLQQINAVVLRDHQCRLYFAVNGNWWRGYPRGREELDVRDVVVDEESVAFDVLKFLEDDLLLDLIVIAGEDSREFPVVNMLQLLIIPAILLFTLYGFSLKFSLH